MVLRRTVSMQEFEYDHGPLLTVGPTMMMVCSSLMVSPLVGPRTSSRGYRNVAATFNSSAICKTSPAASNRFHAAVLLTALTGQ